MAVQDLVPVDAKLSVEERNENLRLALSLKANLTDLDGYNAEVAAAASAASAAISTAAAAEATAAAEIAKGQVIRALVQASEGQTALTLTSATGDLTLYRNGTLMDPVSDYTRLGTSVTFANPLSLDDEITTFLTNPFSIADAMPRSGGAFGGPVDFPTMPTIAGAPLIASTVRVLQPEDFGALSYFLIHANTRALYDTITATYSVRKAYLKLLDYTVRRFMRTVGWVNVAPTVNAGGYVTFSGISLDVRQQAAFDYINTSYSLAVPGINNGGVTVSTTRLTADAAAAVANVAVTTAGMQAFFAACEWGAVRGLMAAEDYLINDTIRARYFVNVEGFQDSTRILMHGDVDRDRPVLQTGGVDSPAYGLNISHILFDANFDRVLNPAGDGSVDAQARGTALAVLYTTNSTFTGCGGYDAYKHCIDVTGAFSGRSGVAYAPPPRTQISQNVVMQDCYAEGSGDDLVTTHQCEDIYLIRPRSFFSRATFGTNNSNCIELDDGSRRVFVYDAVVGFAYVAAEIKGHEDAEAASNCVVRGLIAVKTTNGVVVRHIAHGSPGDPVLLSPTGKSIFVDDVLHYPFEYVVGARRHAVRVEAYDGVTLGKIKVVQDYAASDYFGTDATGTNGAIVFHAAAQNCQLREAEVLGFAASICAVRVTSTTGGGILIGQLVTRDGPLRGLHHTGGARVTLTSYDIHRNTATTGSIGIKAVTGLIAIGTGFSSNFETPQSIGA